MKLLSEKLTWLRILNREMHYHKKNYFQGEVGNAPTDFMQ